MVSPVIGSSECFQLLKSCFIAEEHLHYTGKSGSILILLIYSKTSSQDNLFFLFTLQLNEESFAEVRQRLVSLFVFNQQGELMFATGAQHRLRVVSPTLLANIARCG